MSHRVIFLLGLFFLGCTQKPSSQHQIPSNVSAEIDRRISKELYQSVSIGVLYADGSRKYFQYQDQNDTTALSERSLFELGSLTKTFTAYLAQQHLRDESLATIWPELPLDSSVGPISWQALMSHTAGFPRLPISFDPSNWANPFQDYSESDWLQQFKELSVPDSASWAYSNFGFATLGQAICKVSDQSYEQLMSAILSKADMKRTYLSHQDLEKPQDQIPYHLGIPFDHWEFAGPSRFAGGLISCTEDLLSYLDFQKNKNPLFTASSIRDKVPTHIPYVAHETGHLFHKSGWFIFQPNEDHTFLLHNGGTGGFTSFLGFDLNTQTAVAVLSNSLTLVDDIGLGILDSNFQLEQPEPTIAWAIAQKINSDWPFDIKEYHSSLIRSESEEDILGIYWLERLHFGRKQFSISGPLSEILVEALPEDWEANWIRAQNLIAQKNIKEARLYLIEANRLFPDHPQLEKSLDKYH